MEEWKQIEGFGGRYWVSSFGRIYTTYNKRIINPRYRGERRYGFVGLHYNGSCKYVTVHRLVANYFVDNPGPQIRTVINHIDANRMNNRADNLEWVTHEQNTHHAIYETKNFSQHICMVPVKCIETGKVYPSIAEAARVTGGNKSSIKRATQILHYTSGGCHWRRIEL